LVEDTATYKPLRNPQVIGVDWAQAIAKALASVAEQLCRHAVAEDGCGSSASSARTVSNHASISSCVGARLVPPYSPFEGRESMRLIHQEQRQAGGLYRA
jgi:hypothetical protein